MFWQFVIYNKCKALQNFEIAHMLTLYFSNCQFEHFMLICPLFASCSFVTKWSSLLLFFNLLCYGQCTQADINIPLKNDPYIQFILLRQFQMKKYATLLKFQKSKINYMHARHYVAKRSSKTFASQHAILAFINCFLDIIPN